MTGSLVFVLRRIAIGTLALALGTGSVHAQRSLFQGTRWIVGIDRSASRTTQQMKDMRAFVRALTDSLSFGTEITLLETFRANSDSVRQWRSGLASLRRPPRPLSSEKIALDSYRDLARIRGRQMTDTAGMRAITSTDIMSLLQRTASYARSGESKPVVLVLLSDMLNSTPQLNMERRNGIPDSAWIEKQRVAQLLPDLRGVCVVAVGAGSGTQTANSLRQFWLRYLRLAGARVDPANYRQYMLPTDIRC